MNTEAESFLEFIPFVLYPKMLLQLPVENVDQDLEQQRWKKCQIDWQLSGSFDLPLLQIIKAIFIFHDKTYL